MTSVVWCKKRGEHGAAYLIARLGNSCLIRFLEVGRGTLWVKSDQIEPLL